MDTKQYLQQLERLDRRIQNKLSEVHQYRVMAYNASAVSYGERVQTSSKNDGLEKTVLKIRQLEDDADMLVDELVNKKNLIISQIEAMDDVNHYHILYSRYVTRSNWETIADDIGYSVRQTTREHGKALQEFERKFGNFYL